MKTTAALGEDDDDITAYSSALLQFEDADAPTVARRGAGKYSTPRRTRSISHSLLCCLYMFHNGNCTRRRPERSASEGLDAGAVVLLAAEAAVVITVIVVHARLAYKSGSAGHYLAGYLSAITFVFIATCILSPNYEIHIHHSFLAILLWPATCFRSWFSLLVQASLLGMMMNGLMLWGFGGDIWDGVYVGSEVLD